MVIQEIRKFGGDRGGAGAGKDHISFRDLWLFLRRHMLILILATLAGIALGALYMVKTVPIYSAVARLVIDREQARIASQDASTGTIIIEAAEIASEVEIVKSEAIARSVIRELDMIDDPEILEARSWRSALRSAVTSAFSWGAEDAEDADALLDEEAQMRRTMAGFLARMSVRRVGQSYVIEIGYTSTDPVKAARVANAIAQAYMRASLESRSEALTRGATWLESRLVDLGQQAHAAALSVEEYRNRNDITQIGETTSLDHQQVAEISSQLLVAQGNTATEAAKLATINRLLAGNMSEGYVGEALNNTEIVRLREDLRAATVKIETLQSRYGPEGAAVLTAKEEIARLEGEIRHELVRIQGVYKSNLETAETREKLLRDQLDALKKTAAGTNLARVELAELESRATTYRRMYESLLQQLIGALQKQSFPVGDVRMVTAATPPLSKTWPKTTLVMPFSMLLGFAAGISLAGLREAMDRRVGSGQRLGTELGLPVLGRVPTTDFSVAGEGLTPAEASMRYVLEAPYSGFSETLRSVKNSIDAMFPPNSAMVIGVTSVNEGEGKSTIAANLAQLYLNEGIPAVLVDACFSDPHLSRLAEAYGDELGLSVIEAPIAKPERARSSAAKAAAQRSGELKEARTRVVAEKTDLAPLVPVLTAEQVRRSANPAQRFAYMPALKTQLELLRRRYSVIILDLSAFEKSVDARVASTYVDGLLLVLGNHQKMTVERLADALSTFGKSRVGILGVIFNRNMNRREQLASAFGQARSSYAGLASSWRQLDAKVSEKIWQR
ncbi:exopolysaccharide transport family protein [Chelativorans sp. AA-79]|uniref:exopolysaccharide transport family protein n=1 Tax=Chelativorans sp. AA-79 TaxID=3028735 RepID=UPI0023F9BBF3|nr:exopolysaccharide transport family protein [Chelativorans sp. AA-79]WEX10475.1 exopolysaccharide transport family protein [Chelativorans sp. AA-79]